MPIVGMALSGPSLVVGQPCTDRVLFGLISGSFVAALKERC